MVERLSAKMGLVDLDTMVAAKSTQPIGAEGDFPDRGSVLSRIAPARAVPLPTLGQHQQGLGLAARNRATPQNWKRVAIAAWSD